MSINQDDQDSDPGASRELCGKERKEAKRFSLSGAVDREQIQWLQWSRERRRQLLLVSILRMFKVVSGI